MEPVQLLLQSLKQAVQDKEIETLSASDSGLCQNIVDDANRLLSISIDELQRFK
jgi:hypothetical protein